MALGRRKYLELDLEGYLELGGSPMFSKDFGASSYCVLSLPSAARAPLLSISRKGAIGFAAAVRIDQQGRRANALPPSAESPLCA